MAKTKTEAVKVPERVWARVSVGMAGARRGQRVLVDPTDPAMVDLIASKMVVLEDVPAAEEPEPENDEAAPEVEAEPVPEEEPS